MPVYLGEYTNCASAREMKFIRAVFDFCDNDYYNKELVIVSDGCNVAKGIFERQSSKWNNCFFYMMDKQTLFSGSVRDYGLKLCNGSIITYLDSDDRLGKNHLTGIVDSFRYEKVDWIYYDDFYTKYGKIQRRKSDLKFGKVGTSNISHRRVFNSGSSPNWEGLNGYGHDYLFINRLREYSTKYKYVKSPKILYEVCHSMSLKIDH